MFGLSSRSCHRVLHSAVLLNVMLFAFRSSVARAEAQPKTQAGANATPNGKARQVAQAAPRPVAPAPAAAPQVPADATPPAPPPAATPPAEGAQSPPNAAVVPATPA